MISDRDYMRETDEYGPPRLRPTSLTAIILIANAVIFLLQSFLEYYWHSPVIDYFKLSLVGLKHFYLWQLVSYQFLHGGFMHLLLNSVAIFFFGRPMEEALGKAGFLKLYLLGGVAGGLLQMLGAVWFPRFAGPVVGASASGFALIAAYATCYPNRPLTLLLAFILPVTIRAKYLVLFSVLIALYGLLIPNDNVAHAAHLGGIFFGIAFIKWEISGRVGFSQWCQDAFRRKGPATIIPFPGPPPKGSGRIPTTGLDEAEFMSQEVDPILEKISAHGIQSLTARERKILEIARSRMVKR